MGAGEVIYLNTVDLLYTPGRRFLSWRQGVVGWGCIDGRFFVAFTASAVLTRTMLVRQRSL